MADEKISKPTEVVTAAEDQPPNRYTADAQERIARLRELINDFPSEADPKPLTVAERRLARATKPEALENASRVAEERPGITGNFEEDVAKMRDAIAYRLAYTSVRNQYLAGAKHIDEEILRKQLEAAKIARGIYRTAKGFITLDAGDALKTYVADLKEALVGNRRKRKAAPEGGAPPEGGAVAAKK